MIKDYLEIGQIVGTHGVRGELRVQPWCDSPEFFKKFKTLYYDAHGEKARASSAHVLTGISRSCALTAAILSKKPPRSEARCSICAAATRTSKRRLVHSRAYRLPRRGRKQRPSLRHCYRRQSDGRKRRLAYNGRRRGRDAYPRHSRCCVER